MVSVGNRDLLRTIFDSAMAALKDIGHLAERARWLAESQLDPNDWRTVKENSFGMRYTPLTTRNHARMGSRERVLEVARKHPERLKIELNALVTRVLLDENHRAIGVEYLSGERLYRAHARPSDRPGETAPAVCLARGHPRRGSIQYAATA